MRPILLNLIYLGFATLCFFGPQAVRAELPTEEAEFVTGLRSRRLFRLAEMHVRQQMEKPNVPLDQQADWVIELSRIYAAQAIETNPAHSGPLWEKATQVVDDFAKPFPRDDVRSLLPRVQKALVLLAHGELLRHQAEVSSANQALWEEARVPLRKAIEELTSLRAEAAEWQRPGMASRLPPGSPSMPELFALETNLDYQLSRAYRNQGHSYPPSSADRTAALLKAVERLSLLAQQPVEDPLGWPSRLDEISSYRLLEDFQRARQRLEQLDTLKPPPAVALAARAERIRLALDAKLIDEALALVGQGRAIGGQTSPELDYAILEALFASWKIYVAKNDTALATARQQQATQMVRVMQTSYSPYWARRAEALEASYVVGAPTMSGNVAALVRAAENFYRNGQFPDAVKTYDDARKLALQQKETQQAFDCGFTAAAIVYQQRQIADAAGRFLELSADTSHPQSRRAHLAAIGASLQLAQQMTPPDFGQYAKLLEQHLENWPQSESAGEAHWRLGELRERQQKWAEAVRHYAEIPLSDGRYLLGLSSLVRCYRAYLTELRQQDKANEAVAMAAHAAQWFEDTITGKRPEWPEKWSPAQREAAVAAAGFWTYDGVGRFDRAEIVLSAALAQPAEASPEWLTAARQMLVLSLAGQQRAQQALQVLNQLSAEGTDSLLALVSGLSQIAENSSPQMQRELASLQLRSAQLLEPKRATFNEAQRKLLDLTTARALLASGKAAEARPRLEALAKENPRDGDLQEELAQLLSSQQDKEWQTASLLKWRDIERHTKPGQPRWFRARYQQAVAHARLGNQAAALQIITVTRTLHPDLGGPEMKALFDQLTPK